MPQGFFDFHKKEEYYARKIEKIKSDPYLSEHNRKIILRYLQDSELGKTIKKGQKKVIGAGRNLEVAGYLMKMANEWFKKDLDKITQPDMEKFVLDMDKGKIQTQFGTPYSSDKKSNIRKFIRKFYKYLLGDGRHYPELVDWIDTSKKESQIEAVPGLDQGVWKIVELIPEIKKKALVWATFDSGFREGEILNCSIKDVEKRQDGVFYLTCRHSKTRPRTVSLPYSSELLGRWLEIHPKKDDPNAQLWQTSRVMLYKTVKLYAKKALNQNVTVHMLRHTSATFYAPKLDRVAFCKRFGWSYNSPSPDRYIDFAKVNENKVVEMVKGEKIQDLKKELDEFKIRNQALTDQMSIMQKEMEEQVKRNMESYKQEMKNILRSEMKKQMMMKIKVET